MKITFTHLSDGAREGEFVRELFINYIEDGAPLDKIPYTPNESTLRCYLTDDRKGSKTARYVLGFADEEKFKLFLRRFSIDALKHTAETLAQAKGELLLEDYESCITSYFTRALIRSSELRPGRKSIISETSLSLQQELALILNKLAKVDPRRETVELSYEAVAVRSKIKAYYACDITEIHLDRIEDNVVKYYKYIQNQLRLLGVNNFACVINLQEGVRARYLLLKDQKKKAAFVFYGVRNWIMEVAESSDEYAAEILTAYFMQECEVFDAPTK